MMDFVYTKEQTKILDDSSRHTSEQRESMETTATGQLPNLIYSGCKLAFSQCYLLVNFNFMFILHVYGIQKRMYLVTVFILELWSQGMEEIQFVCFHHL